MIELLTKIHDIFYKAKEAEKLEEKLIKMNQKYDKLEEKHHKLVHALNFNGVLDCHACFDKVGLSCQHMLLCPKCGNKRCPKASDHNLECTNSNEPGQAGSVYGNQ
jgi:prolyl-tRNA synthetase